MKNLEMLGKKGNGIAWWLVLLFVAILGLILIALWATGTFAGLEETYRGASPEETAASEINKFRLLCIDYTAGAACDDTKVPSELKGPGGQCKPPNTSCIDCCNELGYVRTTAT